MVVPVFRAVGSLYPFFAKSASKTAFLKQKERIKHGRAGPHRAALAPKVSTRELRERKATTRFQAHPFTESPQHRDDCRVLRRADRRRGAASRLKRQSLAWCAGQGEGRSRPQEKPTLRPSFPWVTRAAGHRPRAPPFTLRLDFPDQTSAELRLWHRTPTPARNLAPGMAAPATVIKRETSNRPLIHWHSRHLPHKVFPPERRQKQAKRERSTSGACGDLGWRGGANSAPGRLIVELWVPRGARTCLEYFTPSGAEE